MRSVEPGINLYFPIAWIITSLDIPNLSLFGSCGGVGDGVGLSVGTGERVGVGMKVEVKVSGRFCFSANKYDAVMPTPRTKITTISIFTHIGLKNPMLPLFI